MLDSATSAEGRKICLANGTWWRSSSNGMEWTDYSACVDIQGFRYLYYTGVTGNVISLVCLIPACVIFLYFKQLLKQHRIRIHLNLMMTFVLTNASWLWWEDRVFRDRLENSHEETAFMHSDSVRRHDQTVLHEVITNGTVKKRRSENSGILQKHLCLIPSLNCILSRCTFIRPICRDEAISSFCQV
ncbi:hypothetical protein RRG08_022446 [Elysia crispata]|uniref:G-protein coupled receptors family 2 profile 2 domain-containing protein n=1 Tax=Elysia crispata TaxID=231223 RepID=A0AAE1D8V2_9GAST|nr:hypothetical protein RRG08_022446 [Elysia crispata]